MPTGPLFRENLDSGLIFFTVIVAFSVYRYAAHLWKRQVSLHISLSSLGPPNGFAIICGSGHC